jgi:hypothetical protein
MFIDGAAAVERQQFRFHPGKVGLRAAIVLLARFAEIMAFLHNALRFRAHFYRTLEQRAFVIERTQREIMLRHIGLKHKQRASV